VGARGQQLAVHRVIGRRTLGRTWRARLDQVPDPGLAGGAVLDGEGALVGVLLGRGSESLVLADGKRRVPVDYCMRVPHSPAAGWVIPLDVVASAVDSIREGLRGQEGFLGVRARMPGPGESLVEGSGVAIAEVVAGSPADRAGILADDHLIALAGDPLKGWDELTLRVGSTHPGTSLPIELLRNGARRSVVVRLGDRAHFLWREHQKRVVGGRERALLRQIEGLQQELELLRHLLAAYR
jgi:S1-C subfamily serine protease